MKGFIKLHRSLEHSQVFEDPLLLKTWLWVLMRAVWKPVKLHTVGRELKKGEFATTYSRAAGALGCTVNTVRRHFKRLEHMDQIRVRSDTRFTTVSVVNYRVYQTDDEKNYTTTNTTTDTRTDTRTDKRTAYRRRKKEDKEGKKGTPPVLNSKRGKIIQSWVDYKGPDYTETQQAAFIKTVEHLPDNELESKVNKAIASGWKGLGDLSREPQTARKRRTPTYEESQATAEQNRLYVELMRLREQGRGKSNEAETIKQELSRYEG